MDNYAPDTIRSALDAMIASQSGPEPDFDNVTRDLLWNNYAELQEQLGRCKASDDASQDGQAEPTDNSCEASVADNPEANENRRPAGSASPTPVSRLDVASLGARIPWLYRLTFRTIGLAEDAGGNVVQWDRFSIALRFLPDYLTRADRFEMLRIVEPVDPRPFHPNISPDGAVCLEIYPGESLLEICRSIHELLRWRLRQYDERDALNPKACAWGRAHVDAPIDDRPLFGRRWDIQWSPVLSTTSPE